MIYRGRNIDPLSLWGEYVEFPPNMDTQDEFAAKTVCPNPMHDTMKKHFQVNLRQPTVHCFASCGISGSFEHALSIVHGFYEDVRLDEAKDEKTRLQRKRKAWRKARRLILKHARIPTGEERKSDFKRRRRSSTPEPAVALPSLESFSYLPERARGYLSERGIRDRSISKFQLGYDPAERRIVVPVFDGNGKLRLVIKRAIREKDHPKYLYTEGVDKARFLYGLDKMDLGMIKSWGLVLVEGSIDAIITDQNTGKPVCAILGSALSEFQAEIIRRLRPRRLYCFFDKDLSGISALKSVHALLPTIPISVCRYPRGKNDPAVMSGREANRSFDRAVPIAVFNARVSRSRRRITVG